MTDACDVCGRARWLTGLATMTGCPVTACGKCWEAANQVAIGLGFWPHERFQPEFDMIRFAAIVGMRDLARDEREEPVPT